MSPRGRTVSRRRRNALIGGGGLIATIAAIVAIYALGGQEDLIPPVTPDGVVFRIDLLATRDLDTTTPCGLPAGGGGGSANKPLVSDQTWTRTGGSSCYPISATAAQCFDATEIPYTVDATGIGWAVEPDGVNRVLYNTAIDCTNWTCSGTGTATPGQTAPDGSATASLLTVGTTGNDVKYQASGYTNSTALRLRLWYKGTADIWITNPAGSTDGLWTIVGASLSGNWELLDANHVAVTVVNAWASTGTGLSGVQFRIGDGTTTGYVWATTLTEEPGTGYAVIPTGAAAVSTGDPAWVIDNTSGNYYQSGDTVTQTLSQISGTCWVVSGTDLLLTGAAGSECSGVWYSLQVSP